MVVKTEALDLIAEETQKEKQKEEDEKDIKEIMKAKGFIPSDELLGLNRLREQVFMFLVKRQISEATELIVKEIKKDYKIYSIRSDENSEMWIYSEGIYIPEAKSFIREFVRGILGRVFSTTFCNQVISKIEVDTYIDADKFFINNNVEEIVVNNGILNLHTRKLRDYTSREIFFNKINVTYDESKDCPNIKKHFEEVLKNKEDIPVIEELIGYLLYKEYSIEKAFMFEGSGRNGKGKTIELMKKFIGIRNCCSVALQELDTDSFSLSKLVNKMANLCGDISKSSLINTGYFKQLTGRDMISANRKFLPRIDFVNYAKMVFSANEFPVTYDTSEAFWNRWVILEFPYKFLSEKEIENIPKNERENCKVADVKIVEKLTTDDELSGLLNLALTGLGRLLEKGDFSYSKSVADVKKLWIRLSDSFSSFLMDCVEEEWNIRITKQELRHAYSLYCKEHKLAMSNDKVLRAILTKTYAVGEERENYNDKQIYCWNGIKFKNSQGSQDSQGFSTYTKKNEKCIGRKKVTSLTTLTISDKMDTKTEKIED